MHTDHVDIFLPDYVRGRLASDEIGPVERHLRECDACRSKMEEVRLTFAALDRASTEEVPQSYFSSVLPRVHERIDRRSQSTWNNIPLVTRIILPTGAAAMLIVLLWLVPFTKSSITSDNPLQAVVDSASFEDIAEILQQDIPSHELSSFSDTVITHALTNDQFVQRELVQEALAGGTDSPFDVFENVSPQQMLGSFDENETAQILQQLKMESL